MITKFFSTVNVRMPATGRASKLGRVFLAQIPPRQRSSIELKLQLLTPGAVENPIIQVKYKDGTTLDMDPSHSSTVEMVERFDRHSRQLQIQEQLNE